MRDTWEYEVTRIQAVNDGSLETTLNEWGENGWELVSLTPYEPYANASVFAAVFKRNTCRYRGGKMV